MSHVNLFFEAVDSGTGRCLPPELVSLVLSLAYVKKGEHGLLDLYERHGKQKMRGVLCLDHNASAWVSGIWSFHFEPRLDPFQWYLEDARMSIPENELSALPQDIVVGTSPAKGVVRAVRYPACAGDIIEGQIEDATAFAPYPEHEFHYRAVVRYEDHEYSGGMWGPHKHGRGAARMFSTGEILSGKYQSGLREGLFDQVAGGHHLRAWYERGRRVHGTAHCTRGKETLVIHGDVNDRERAIPSGYCWMKSNTRLYVGCIYEGKLDGEGMRITPNEGRVEIAEFDEGEMNLDFPWTRVTCDPAGVGVALPPWGTECKGVKTEPTRLSAQAAQDIKALADNLDLSCPICKLDKQGRPNPIDAGDNRRIAKIVSNRRKRKLDFMLGE